ncbi:MAG: HEAT repeat domain-containing protein [Rhodomicrobium sp.]|jgi:HEAT repeat protein
MALVRATKNVASIEAGAEREKDASAAGLASELRSDEPSRRRQAARELARLPEGIPLLCDHLEREPAISVRSVIMTALIQSRSCAAVEGLTRYLRSENTALRNEAIEALQEMPGEIAPYMEALLRDPESDVRIFAVNILAVLPNARAPEWLHKVILEDDHVNVCAAAVDCLAEVGTPASIAPLKELRLRFGDQPFMTFAIDATLKRIGETQ